MTACRSAAPSDDNAVVLAAATLDADGEATVTSALATRGGLAIQCNAGGGSTGWIALAALLVARRRTRRAGMLVVLAAVLFSVRIAYAQPVGAQMLPRGTFLDSHEPVGKVGAGSFLRMRFQTSGTKGGDLKRTGSAWPPLTVESCSESRVCVWACWVMATPRAAGVPSARGCASA
jgi:hypothetical protein